MAAGLGFKDFVTGEVLTAADVDGYLMQGIWVFADATARDAAVTSPQEGNFAFLKDTNVTTYYTGSAWTNLDTTGMVNPMTTTGDTIYSSSGSTPARLGIGTTGQVLTVAGGVPTWATAGGASYTYTAFTPTWTNVTVGNATVTARYVEIDKFIHFYVNFTLGSTSSVTGRIRMDFPVAIKDLAAAESANLHIEFYDTGTGPVLGYHFIPVPGSPNTFEAAALNTAGTYAAISVTNATVPFTWASTDQILISGIYERS
jgi:hypothetical protein